MVMVLNSAIWPTCIQYSLRLQNSRIFCERERRTIFEQNVWSEWKNGEGEWWEKGVWGSRASHSRITLTALPAFRKRLFCSLVFTLINNARYFVWNWNRHWNRPRPQNWFRSLLANPALNFLWREHFHVHESQASSKQIVRKWCACRTSLACSDISSKSAFDWHSISWNCFDSA